MNHPVPHDRRLIRSRVERGRCRRRGVCLIAVEVESDVSAAFCMSVLQVICSTSSDVHVQAVEIIIRPGVWRSLLGANSLLIERLGPGILVGQYEHP